MELFNILQYVLICVLGAAFTFGILLIYQVTTMLFQGDLYTTYFKAWGLFYLRALMGLGGP
ncbi:MAG: hypothetical protein ACTSRG_09840 [Candidatus Helarchaeota archaeon]